MASPPNAASWISVAHGGRTAARKTWWLFLPLGAGRRKRIKLEESSLSS
jgi:hypothetical protein